MLNSAIRIITKLEERGHRAYIAGGWVRDHLMGIDAKDIDIATSARPDEVLQIFGLHQGMEVGKCFGVVLVPAGGHVFEVATFRKDGHSEDGRHPDSVEFTRSEKEDVMRRDFTINGMLYHPRRGVVDYVGGRQDVRDRVIRFIGNADERINEDHLRMLRAVRFATKYRMEMAPGMSLAIERNAEKVNRLAKERVLQEMTRILMLPARARGVRLLDVTELLQQIIPEMAMMRGLEQPPKFHPEGDVFRHTCLVLEKLPATASRELVWAALLHDVGKMETHEVDENGRHTFHGHDKAGAVTTRRILAGLRADTELREMVSSMVGNHMRFRYVREMRRSTLARFVHRPTFEDELLLHRADCLASNGIMENWEYLQPGGIRETIGLPAIMTEKFPKVITGFDLINLGLKPGPQFKQILQEVHDHLVDAGLPLTEESKEEAMDLVRGKFWPVQKMPCGCRRNRFLKINTMRCAKHGGNDE